jgi:hypothetical protein
MPDAGEGSSDPLVVPERPCGPIEPTEPPIGSRAR